MSALVRAEGIARHYEVRRQGGLFGQKATLRAVDGVSFAIEKGKTLGLVGESGCGKSTTARLVLGIVPLTAGRVLFDGKAVDARQNATWRRRRRRMQMIYQDPLGALDRRLTVAAQVSEPFAIHEPTLTAAERMERTRDLIASVGLQLHHEARYPHELSGGQRQRVVIARALALEPDFLVCDEPVSALDVSVQAQVLNLLEDLQARSGFAALFISHDLKVVRQMADKVAVMYLGEFVEEGRPDEVFKDPLHPYSKALVSAIPTPRRSRLRERIVLTGDPPNPVDKAGGCPFHPRCPMVMDVCRTLVPALTEVSGRKVACHLVSPPAFSTQAAHIAREAA